MLYDRGGEVEVTTLIKNIDERLEGTYNLISSPDSFGTTQQLYLSMKMLSRVGKTYSYLQLMKICFNVQVLQFRVLSGQSTQGIIHNEEILTNDRNLVTLLRFDIWLM